ncbi:hypothetical protein [Streptomyces violascens]|uniref:hypothetical protein n=1 Tax=Streptomyces violascens TaxID=67381 RepID=UPI001677D601|nr:hypothetical protein [Streptomyces violascens]GGU42885.1 hypothetical protein GCM10010289_74560 [Streptomyces violascens]
MSKATVRLEVSAHQYWIAGDVPEFGGWDYSGFNGLIASLDAGRIAHPGQFAVVMTGTDTGGVTVTLDVRNQPPEQVDTDAWDDVVEISLDCPGEYLAVTSDCEADEELPDFTDAQPGPFRIRVHARGRDAGEEASLNDIDGDAEPVEEHLVIAWPAPVAPETIHKATDRFGAGIRAR